MAGMDLVAMFRTRLRILGFCRRLAMERKRQRMSALVLALGVFVRERKLHLQRVRIMKLLTVGCVHCCLPCMCGGYGSASACGSVVVSGLFRGVAALGGGRAESGIASNAVWQCITAELVEQVPVCVIFSWVSAQ